MKPLWTGLAFLVFINLTAVAEPVVKVINFTADWCPNCQILNPAIENALTRFDENQIELVNLDMTNAGRRASQDNISQTWTEALRLAHQHQVLYLWSWYGGITGLAAIVSADTGEPIACVTRSFDEDAIHARLQEAITLTTRRAPGARKPDGPECPPPVNEK
ncbi:MAG: thioredoxin family protein [Pseudomonadota bacterium]